MNLLKTKQWPIMDLAIFKWCMLSIGIIIGATFASFVKEYLWIFITIAVITFIRAFYFYYLKD